MAPPVYARMYVLTGRPEFLEFMDREYKATYEYLYDKEARLFYRDWRYFDNVEANGEKVFWGRGNGWVLGGLAELLQILPETNAYRDFYEDLFVDLAARLAGLQSPDGYWHASLLDPASYPSPETSATGFIVYGLAYGVNAGLLDAASQEGDPRDDRGLRCRSVLSCRSSGLYDVGRCRGQWKISGG